MDFKVGDWVEFPDFWDPRPKQIVRINNGVAFTKDNKCLLEQLSKWAPHPDEYCWFWNTTTLVTHPVIATFERMLNESFETDIGPFDHCEPFIGSLPSYLRE